MKSGKIRPLAIGIFLRNDDILVFEGYDPKKEQRFYRPLGGAIEFGEYGYQALIREMREEIGVEVKDIHYLGVCENILYYDGQPGHEIVLIYEGTLVGNAIYNQDSFTGHEDDGSPMQVVWKSLAGFRRGEAPLYPHGLLDMLAGRTSTAGKEAPCAIG
jgi:8-oxo-dGTP pyrophosphatase MutT (NUDIX family)